ncbi:hypothetical protein JMJ35_006668 [Cladonia borealis]|uniref:Uncharacterized protein n=1 Tax=Cladonia borealis TaxID=184061 RepID=A0AA39R0C9_9LECA|nr:hypothetical protein JMJ35_006668 [Cladonia borealis]
MGTNAILEDVYDGINALKEALGTKDSYKHLGPDTVRDLLALYLIKFDLVDGYPDLDEAISTGSLAIRVSQPDDPERRSFAHNLATLLDHRYTLSKITDGLMRSIRIWRHLVNTAQASGEQSEGAVNGLLSALLNQFKSTSDITTLDEAIEIGEQAVEAINTVDEGRNALLMSLALCFGVRFGSLGKTSPAVVAVTSGAVVPASGTNPGSDKPFSNTDGTPPIPQKAAAKTTTGSIEAPNVNSAPTDGRTAQLGLCLRAEDAPIWNEAFQTLRKDNPEVHKMLEELEKTKDSLLESRERKIEELLSIGHSKTRREGGCAKVEATSTEFGCRTAYSYDGGSIGSA